jgi:hypothetical protein
MATTINIQILVEDSHYDRFADTLMDHFGSKQASPSTPARGVAFGAALASFPYSGMMRELHKKFEAFTIYRVNINQVSSCESIRYLKILQTYHVLLSWKLHGALGRESGVQIYFINLKVWIWRLTAGMKIKSP